MDICHKQALLKQVEKQEVLQVYQRGQHRLGELGFKQLTMHGNKYKIHTDTKCYTIQCCPTTHLNHELITLTK